jgi:hypothetical protein
MAYLFRSHIQLYDWDKLLESFLTAYAHHNSQVSSAYAGSIVEPVSFQGKLTICEVYIICEVYASSVHDYKTMTTSVRGRLNRRLSKLGCAASDVVLAEAVECSGQGVLALIGDLRLDHSYGIVLDIGAKGPVTVNYIRTYFHAEHALVALCY